MQSIESWISKLPAKLPSNFKHQWMNQHWTVKVNICFPTLRITAPSFPSLAVALALYLFKKPAAFTARRCLFSWKSAHIHHGCVSAALQSRGGRQKRETNNREGKNSGTGRATRGKKKRRRVKENRVKIKRSWSSREKKADVLTALGALLFERTFVNQSHANRWSRWSRMKPGIANTPRFRFSFANI